MTIQEMLERASTARTKAEGLQAEYLTLAEKEDFGEEDQTALDAITVNRDKTTAEAVRFENAAKAQADLEPSQPLQRRSVADDPLNANDINVGKNRLADDPKGGFAHMGAFASDIFNVSGQGGGMMSDPLQMWSAATGLNQGTGSDGGFLVPPAFSTMIWDEMREGHVDLLGMTDQFTIPAGTDSLTFPANAETSRATGSRYGGVRGYWLAEAEQMTVSKPTLRQMKLEPQDLGVLVYSTDKLLRNGGAALGQFVTQAAGSEINFLVGDAILNGDGAGKPLGVVGHNATVSVAKETNQANATIVRENIDKMWSRCFAPARARAVWLINQDIEPALEQLSADVGTGGVPVYLPAGGIADAPNARLKGRPVIATEWNATLGTVGDIILADMSSYATGTTGGIDTAASIHLRFDFNETAFRFMFSVDGQPWLASALTPFKGTATKSPIVTLATRSS